VLAGFTPWPTEVAERYRREGYWRGDVLGSLLRDWAGDPGRIAVVAGGTRHTYAELDARADRLAAGLSERGIGRADRVVVQLPNTVDFVVVCVALFRLGALPVLALPAHRRSEITYLCEYAAAVALVVPDIGPDIDYRDIARAVVTSVPSVRQVFVAGEPAEFTPLSAVSAQPRQFAAPDPSDVAFFLLSGGTTGLPKLIPRTHDDYAFQLRATAAAMGFTEDSAYLAVLPVAHNAALGCPGVLGALWAGGRAVLAATPSPDEVFPLISTERIQLTTVMPPVLALWLETAELFGADLSGLIIEVGGATLSPELGRRVRATLGATLTHWFGMAEGILCFTRLDDSDETAATTQGHPMCAAEELRVVDAQDRDVLAGEIGQLLVRGPCVLRGYYRVPEHNTTVFTGDGFLRTGDLVRIDADGRLVVSGRIKDVINRGGEKISADEVESHLIAHPAVRRVAVVPVADRVLGEKSCAVIVATSPSPTLGELKEFLRGRGLAEYKLPDRLEVVAALPHTGVGKVDRRAVGELLRTAPR
jgi:2,3-dihydroxybenzoate-AMP ligase